jgi:hypothetical protein
VYKSDTQGIDPWLATQYDSRFWERVDVAILELWRLPRAASGDLALADSSTRVPGEAHAPSHRPPGPSLHPRDVDLAALARVLDRFPHKALLPPAYSPDPSPQPWTTRQALDYLQGDDGRFANLGLWR